MPSIKQRQLQRQQARQQQKKRRFIYLGAGLIALVLALVAVGFYINPSHASSPAAAAENCTDIQTLADEGNAHLLPGQTHEYQANPPVSGPHNPDPWPAGIYDTPIPAIREVHSLEHGYVILHYKGMPSDEVQQLAALVGADSWKMILAPLPSMAYKVSLTAWDHVQTCGGVDTQVIHNFVNRFRDHGPEQTPM